MRPLSTSVARKGHLLAEPGSKALIRVVLCLCVCAAPLAAQNMPPMDLPTLLGSVGAPNGGLDSLRAGRPLAFQVSGRPSNEIAIFAAVAVSTTADEFLTRFGDLDVYRRRASVHTLGSVSSPPALSDFDSLPVPPDDFSALRSCRVGSCAIKLPASVILEATAARAAPLASIMSALLLRLSQGYLEGGIDSLPGYGDKPSPTTPSQALDSLLAGPTPVLSLFPDLVAELEAPDRPLSDSRLFWTRESFGLRDILELNATSARATGRPDWPAVVLTVRLYSSHYFLAGYAVVSLLAESSSAGAPGGTFLVYAARYRLDTALNVVERRQLSGRLHSYALELITAEKAALESN